MSNSATSAVIKIDDEFLGHDKATVCCGKFYEKYVENVLISESSIRERTKVLAGEIHRHFPDGPLRMLCVLKGAFRFFTLLLDELYKLRAENDLSPIRVEFIRAKSYSNTQSTNSVQVSGDHVLEKLENEHVLIVEDIVDTGLTASELVTAVRARRPASISIVSMLVKRISHAVSKADFAGFEIPNRFVVGFGLDYNEYFRDLNHICVINSAGIEEFKE